jgi:hypothetical protein
LLEGTSVPFVAKLDAEIVEAVCPFCNDCKVNGSDKTYFHIITNKTIMRIIMTIPKGLIV